MKGVCICLTCFAITAIANVAAANEQTKEKPVTPSAQTKTVKSQKISTLEIKQGPKIVLTKMIKTEIKSIK